MERLRRLSAVAADRLVGSVHISVSISVPGPFAPIFVLPALSRLAHEHPDLVPVLRSHPLAEAVDRLRRGVIDLAVLPDVVAGRHGLHRLPVTDLPPATLYLVRRPPLPLGSRAEVVATAIRAVAAGDDSPGLSAPGPQRR